MKKTVLLTMAIAVVHTVIAIPEGDDVDINITDQRISFTACYAGIMYQKFTKIHSYGYYDGLSDYIYVSEPIEHNYRGFGAGISITWKNGQYFYQSFALRTYIESDRFENKISHVAQTTAYFVANPIYKMDWKLVGIGLGLHLGKFTKAQNSEVYWSGELVEYNVFPQFNFRLGPKEYVYFEYKVMDVLPAGTPMPLQQIGIGTGLGKLEKNKIEAGWADNSGYLNAIWAINRNWLVEAYLMDNFKSGSDKKSIFSLNAHYRFNFKNKRPY